MSAVMPKSRFIHIPKTGGVWVERSIDYFVDGSYAVNNPNPHVGVEDCPGDGLLTFAFVRDPLEWYKSYWSYKMTKNWDAANQFDKDCYHTEFSGFIDNMLNRFWLHRNNNDVGILGGNNIICIGIHPKTFADYIELFLSRTGNSDVIFIITVIH